MRARAEATKGNAMQSRTHTHTVRGVDDAAVNGWAARRDGEVPHALQRAPPPGRPVVPGARPDRGVADARDKDEAAPVGEALGELEGHVGRRDVPVRGAVVGAPGGCAVGLVLLETVWLKGGVEKSESPRLLSLGGTSP